MDNSHMEPSRHVYVKRMQYGRKLYGVVLPRARLHILSYCFMVLWSVEVADQVVLLGWASSQRMQRAVQWSLLTNSCMQEASPRPPLFG